MCISVINKSKRFIQLNQVFSGVTWWCGRRLSVAKMSKLTVLLFVMYLMIFLWCIGEGASEEQQPSGYAIASQTAATTGSPEGNDVAGDGKDLEYHTPLAGEPFHTVFMGGRIDVPGRDLGHVTALTLGGTFFTPKQGSTVGIPIGALYVKRVWEESRTRDVVSIFVNDLEYDRSFQNLELVCRFETDTIPGGQTIVLNNEEIKQSSVEWGTLFASLGPGLRYKVAPFQIDNDLRLQFLGRIGYFYNKRTSDTGSNVVLPPDTMLYGTKLRGRYDGMRRNLLELPHKGVAAGFDLDYMYRDKWSDQGSLGNTIFTKANTQGYLQFSGYVMGVGGIPGMSEKNRILISINGGTSGEKSVDRFNAFQIGGGPLPGETDDLYRLDYPGTMFNEILVADYALANLEYRRELTFFMYLHLRGSFIWADQLALSSTNQVVFKSSNGQAATIGLDTGFLRISEVYLAYSWDSGFIRNGKPGSGIILTWNKAF